MKNAALELLVEMLKSPERIAPWSAAELAGKCALPVTTAYRNLRVLSGKELVAHVAGGYILGAAILAAGVKYHAHLSALRTPDKLQEELYGRRKSS